MPSLTGNWSEHDGPTVAVRVGVSRRTLFRLRGAWRPIPQPADLTALLDSGAEMSCIDAKVVRGLGLAQYGAVPVNMPATGGLIAAVQYSASLTVIHPSGDPRDDLVVPDLPLTEVDLGPLGYEVLIGRDVLVRCHFQLDGPGLTFTLDY